MIRHALLHYKQFFTSIFFTDLMQCLLYIIVMLFKCSLVALFLVQCLFQDPVLKSHIIPLYGNASLGYYYANIYVGTPRQEQSVIMDTGSGQLALPCSKCTACGNRHIHQPFSLQKSTSSKLIVCVYNLSFRIKAGRNVGRAVEVGIKMIPVPSQFHMLKAALSQASSLRINFNSKEILPRNQLKLSWDVQPKKLTCFSHKLPMAYSAQLLSGNPNYCNNYTKNILNLRGNNFYSLCVWLPMEDT